MNFTSAPNVFVTSCLARNEAIKFVHTFPTQFILVSHVVAFFFSVLSSFTTIILNSLTFATIWSSPEMRKSISLFLIMIFSGIGAVSGLVSNSAFTLRLGSEISGNVECWVLFAQRKSSIFMTIISSFVTVSVINLERYFGVVHPIFHRVKLQKSTFQKFLVLSWTACAIIFGLSFYNDEVLVRFTTISCVAFMLFTVYSYTCIGIKVIKSERLRMTVPTESPGKDTSVPTDRQNMSLRKEKMRLLKELKSAKSCFIIATCHILCFIPATVFLGVMHGNLSDSSYIIATAWCVNLSNLNDSLNPLILFFRNRKLRQETHSLLKKVRLCLR